MKSVGGLPVSHAGLFVWLFMFVCNYSMEYLLSLYLNWDAYHVLSNTWKTGSFIEEEIGGGEVKGSCCWLYGADLKSLPPISHDLSSS